MPKKEKIIDLAFIKSEIKRMDSTLKESENAYKVALILLSSLVVGADSRKIMKFTELPMSFIETIAKRLRKNKVWVKRDVDSSTWFIKKTGVTAFWLDVSIGLGYLKRAK